MGLFDKVKAKVSSSSSSSTGTAVRPAQSFPHVDTIPLDDSALPRYRKQRGVNLGAWFVSERWIYDKPYQQAASPGQSDFDIASGGDAKRLYEEHWDSYMTEEDWQWLADRGFNNVRLPIAYWHLAQPCPEALQGTDFERHAHIYEGAWQRILAAVQAAKFRGLGVLIDLHGAPGGQNADAHCGRSDGKVNFWSHDNLRAASIALHFLASYFAPDPYIIGLELLNEPKNNDQLQGFYDQTIASIRGLVGPEFPIYVHDGWDTQWYAGWAGNRSDFTVLDHHLYRCFGGDDVRKSVADLTADLRGGFRGYFASLSDKAKGNLVVGEWSGALAPQSMPKVATGEQDALRRDFVKAQLELYEQYTGGWWWWCFKKQSGWDAGWSARDANRAEILPSFAKPAFREPPQGAKEAKGQQAAGDHVGYWETHGGSPNPGSFRPGFDQGWEDALLFLRNGDELGFFQQWARRRAAERQLGDNPWEFEHGFKQGAEAAKQSCQ